MTKHPSKSLRIGIVVPHIFMHRDILPHVIFSPAQLALRLADGLQQKGAAVTIFTPGPVHTMACNTTADLRYFEQELAGRGNTYTELLKKHPFTFVTLARQVQSELIAKAYKMANDDELDIVHIYTNEEEIALPFASLCTKPVVFTHHDPFNFLIKYKNLFPKYPHLNWLSMSYAQRASMPDGTNWVGNIYHGVDTELFRPAQHPQGGYVLIMGRIIQPKGVHLAIAAVKAYNRQYGAHLKLKIAGKHYAGHAKDAYWQEQVLPHIDNKTVEYLGFVGDDTDKQQLMANADALLVPSLFQEPFGMVVIEALACGTPVIGLDSGAIPELITNGMQGFVVPKVYTDGKLDEQATGAALAQAIAQRQTISREVCRHTAVEQFALARMVREHLEVYRHLTK